MLKYVPKLEKSTKNAKKKIYTNLPKFKKMNQKSSRNTKSNKINA